MIFCCLYLFFFFFFSSRRRHTRCREVSWARRCVQETGSKGVFLSGGEKQRIAIARAILKNAHIIIMDEASAAVDPENEHELQKAFANLMKGKTVIMIAHRLSSIRAVDEILVMDKGKIIERGNDQELMEKDSQYKYFQELYGKANDWRVSYEESIQKILCFNGQGSE
eukprot:TRINITY_DN762_c0_g2_i3.p3 TRINITY_DN762_c0_g2~~TRINITY_DN762_c0_g2_i3.p3  ORF type:complete len:168 (-),score=48.02 TRINITY_DN762_c0_g2_i3:578-1081(-)